MRGLAGRDETSQVQSWRESTPVAVPPFVASASRSVLCSWADARCAGMCRACVVKKRSVHARSLSLCCCCVLAARNVFGLGAASVLVFSLFCFVKFAFLSGLPCAVRVRSSRAAAKSCFRKRAPLLLTRYEQCTLSRISQYTEDEQKDSDKTSDFRAPSHRASANTSGRYEPKL